ncbi:hypothetical protein N9232_00450 [Akkermansiaceae bacterium]|nr:hypothetical protein [Akkermansiaceae bacterium]
MAIFRGVGGSGDSSDNSFLQEVTAQANAASASATAASASAVLAQASANSILTLTAATGDAGTNVSYNASTGVLTVPRGADGTDASVTAANVTGVLTGGTGISIASNGTITNDSPDQTVALTGTGATTITGTYPNFTINSVNTTYTVGDGGLTTNDFTDADHSKLNGIEAIADVTDTANVTAAGAAMLTGATFTGDVLFNDGVKAKFGTDSDLLIYHNDGEPSVIEDAGELGLVLKTNGNIFAVTSDTNETMITATPNGGVSLYYDNTVKVLVSESTVAISEDLSVESGNNLIVQGGDLDVDGDIIVSGTVDGRDVAADGTKLDGITPEASASYNYTTQLYQGYLNLTTAVNQVGPDFYLRNYSDNHYKRFVEVAGSVSYAGLTSTNDLNLRTILVVPSGSGSGVDIGSVDSITTTGTYNRDIVIVGDVSHWFSEYSGTALTADGTSTFSSIVSAIYNPTTNKTTINAGTFGITPPSVGDSIYVHPFDWESAGTEIYGVIKQLDADNEATMSYEIYNKVYFGNIDRVATCRIKLYEATSSDSVVVQRLRVYQLDERA